MAQKSGFYPPSLVGSLEVVVTQADFDVAHEYRLLCESATHAGAVVFFVGFVRDIYADTQEQINYLELEHYPGMTERLCQEIIDDARARYSFDAVKLIHRVGRVMANEQIVFVAVASGHRDSAFCATQYIMDYLKTRATFWKKEVGSQGEQWLGVKEKDLKAAERWLDEQE